MAPVLSRPKARVATGTTRFPERTDGDRHLLDPMLDGRPLLFVWACVGGLLAFVVLQLLKVLLHIR